MLTIDGFEVHKNAKTISNVKKCDNSIRCSYCRTNFIFPVRFRWIGIEHDRPCSGCKGEGAAAEQGKCRIGDFHHRSGVCGTAYGGWCCLGGRFIVTKPIRLSHQKKPTSSCVRTGRFLCKVIVLYILLFSAKSQA